MSQNSCVFRNSLFAIGFTLASNPTFAQSLQSESTVTLGFDGLAESSLDVGDLGVSFNGAAVLTCGSRLNCGAFPPFSGDNVIFDNFGSGGVITAAFDQSMASNVLNVSARITGNRTVTMTAFNADGIILDQSSTSGPNFFGSGGGAPNELVSVRSETDPITMVIIRDGGNTFTIDDFSFDGVQSRRVVIDAGHGRKSDGTFDRDPAPPTGIIEDLVTLDISRAVGEELSASPGIVFRQTRESVMTVPISMRLSIAEGFEADAFVSIHTNAVGNPIVNGSETLINETRNIASESRMLASAIQPRISTALGMNSRGVRDSRDLDRILRLGVLKSDRIPSTIAEIGFHTNSELNTADGQTVTDNEQLADPVFRRRAGRSVALGVLDYLDSIGNNEE